MNETSQLSPFECDLIERIESRRDQLVELCRRLVQVNTVNRYAGDGTEGNEAAGQQILEPVLTDAGAQVRLFDVPGDIYERMGVVGPKGRDFSGRPNLVAEWVLGDGPTLVINGHMDTVGAAGMEFDPFAAAVRDSAIWGRGTTDCKGQLSAAATSLQALMESAEGLSGRIIFQSVVEEECSGSGAGTLACIDAGFPGDAVLIIDGSGLQPTVGCLGVFTADIRVPGKAGHGSFNGAVNAIEKARVALQGWGRFVESRRKNRPDCPTNLGVFRSGSHPAVVPHEAFLSMNINYALEEAELSEQQGRGWGASLCLEQLEKAIEVACARDEWLSKNQPVIELVKDLYPFNTPTDDPFAVLIQRAAEDVMGEPCAPVTMPAWFDGAHFAVQREVPVVGFGGGLSGQAHSATEHVMIDHLVTEAKMIAVVASRYLGGP